MPKVTFNGFSGGTHTVEVPPGTTLMRAATDNRVPGIDGDCGGNWACATGHVYVDPDWSARGGTRTATQEDMLNLVAALPATSHPPSHTTPPPPLPVSSLTPTHPLH